MSRFEERWAACVARARKARGQKPAPPFGFTTRVLAAAAARDSDGELSLEAAWQRLTVRSLPWVTAFLLICAAIELPHWRDRKPLDPGIENTVAQLVWVL